MKAVGAAPYALVTAVMLEIAVDVAPRLMPLNPAAIAHARCQQVVDNNADKDR